MQAEKRASDTRQSQTIVDIKRKEFDDAIIDYSNGQYIGFHFPCVFIEESAEVTKDAWNQLKNGKDK